MQAFRKLNGWQRLWIVVSGVGFLYAIGLGVFGGIPPYSKSEVISGFNNLSCAAVIKMTSGGKLNPEPKYDDPCHALYLYRSIYKNAKNTEAGYVEHMNSEKNNYILKNIGFLLIVWSLSVAVLYGSGVVVAWGRSGCFSCTDLASAG